MISVCLATYNGAFFIKRQITSILDQLGPEDEVIISDDGSTDDTISVIQSINDSRIKVFLHPAVSFAPRDGLSFYKVTQNFGYALSHAVGEYIFLADQDDIWVAGKVDKCMKALEDNICVVHNYTKIDLSERVTKPLTFSKVPIHKTMFMNVVDSHFRGCCMAFRKEILPYVLPIPTNVIGHDYWIGALASHYGTVSYIMEPLLLSRWYPESVSANRKTSLLYKFSFRAVLLKELIKRICKN